MFEYGKNEHGSYMIVDNIIFPALGQKSLLSLAAIGLLLYLFKDSNAAVVFDISDIKNTFNIGKDKALSILRELIEKGFVQRIEKRNAKGQMDGYNIIIANPKNRVAV